jgi:aryl-alcohol dehydrogenase-like predicted oxidoreductase
METTTIAGIQVSRIGLGTWAIGGTEWGAIPDEVAITTCLSAVERGINLIDTAPIYGYGRAEEIVGKAMRSRPSSFPSIPCPSAARLCDTGLLCPLMTCN